MRVMASAIVFGAWLFGAFAQPALSERSGQRGEGPAAQFGLVQPDLFAAAGGQPNAWADVDNDGDPDLFVGFAAGKPNRLYRNDRGTFVEVAADAGVADMTDTRAAAWGDFDGDGHVDLYVGFTRRSETRNRLYRNDGTGHFTDVAAARGVDAAGETRQVSWIDYDRDGDLDLFVAFRDAPNLLFRNDGARFTSVGKELGVDDPRRTVGAVWFDVDEDGDLDLFTANQNGDTNGLFRNDRGHFADVARAPINLGELRYQLVAAVHVPLQLGAELVHVLAPERQDVEGAPGLQVRCDPGDDAAEEALAIV